MSTARLQVLADITRRSRESIRNMQKGKRLPWKDERPEGEYRRFDGGHALRLFLMDALIEQGVAAAGAAEAVDFHGSAITRFLDAVEARQLPPNLFVGYLRTEADEEITGARWTARTMSLSTADEITGAVASALAAVGTVVTYKSGRRERRTGGPQLAVASIGECYRRLEDRAKAAGYSIDGRSIFRAVPDNTEEEGE